MTKDCFLLIKQELDEVNSYTKGEAEINATAVPLALDQILPKTRKSEHITKKSQGTSPLRSN